MFRLIVGAVAGCGVGVTMSSTDAPSRFGPTAAHCIPNADPDQNPDAVLDAALGDMSGDHAYRKTWGVPWVEDWDNPSSRGLPTQAGTIKRQILLIRHGQYENEGSGHPDAVRTLTKTGQAQARETGRYLRKYLRDSSLAPTQEIAAIHVSSMTRAKQTANLILEGMGDAALKHVQPLYSDSLREIFPCDPQPTYAKKAKANDERTIEEAFTKYFHRPRGSAPSVELMVGHGNVTRYFLCRALQIPPEAWLRFSLPHCSVTSITVTGRGRVSVQQVGSIGHLPADLQTVHNIA